MIYEIRELLGISSCLQGNSISEQFTRIFHGNAFELSIFREMMRLLKNCELMTSGKTENLIDYEEFIIEKVSDKLGQNTTPGVRYKQSFVEKLRLQVILWERSSLALPPHYKTL